MPCLLTVWMSLGAPGWQEIAIHLREGDGPPAYCCGGACACAGIMAPGPCREGFAKPGMELPKPEFGVVPPRPVPAAGWPTTDPPVPTSGGCAGPRTRPPRSRLG